MDSSPTNAPTAVDRAAAVVLQYGLALIMIWFGGLKFTAFEAMGIAPLAMNSPLLSWAFDLLGMQGFSYALGVIEIAVGVLIATRSLSPRLAMIGGIGACITFVITLSLLFTTPGAIQEGYGFPALSGMVGQFLIKDLVLLGASLWVTGASMSAMRTATWAASGGNTVPGDMPS